MAKEIVENGRGELGNAATLPLPEKSGLPAAPVAPQELPTQEAAEIDEEVLGSLLQA